MTQLINAPIGVFDSGMGGLSVFAHLVQQLPHERYVYLADTLHVPYGSREATDIQALTLNAVDWLIGQGCKLVVIACNTASAHGLQYARARYPAVPIVGLVPALKPAVLRSQTKQVAVLATPATLHGYLLNEVIDQVAVPQGVTVHKYSIDSLVPWVELGMPATHAAVDALDSLLHTLIRLQVDQLVLGCTHFPFFKPYLTQRLQNLTPQSTQCDNDMGMPALALIDSGGAIARRVVALLQQSQLLHQPVGDTILDFYSTAKQTATEQVAKRLLQQVEPPLDVRFYHATLS